MHGNYDNVNKVMKWDPSVADHALPASLYLASKPAFFGQAAWPWVTPENSTAPFIAQLPAKERASGSGISAPRRAVRSGATAENALRIRYGPRGCVHIVFRVTGAGERVTLAIVDVYGRAIATLADGRFAAGERTASWNGLVRGEKRAPAGQYIVMLRHNDGAPATKRIALVR